MRNVHRYDFEPEIDMLQVEMDLHLAVLCAGFLHGEPKVSLQFGYYIGGQSVVIRESGKAGDTVNRLFIGICGKEHGRDSFKIEVNPPKKSEAA